MASQDMSAGTRLSFLEITQSVKDGVKLEVVAEGNVRRPKTEEEREEWIKTKSYEIENIKEAIRLREIAALKKEMEEEKATRELPR